jgi:hypothetical protein
MKSIISFLFVLLFQFGFADFYPGSFQFNDGTSKTGLIEIPKFGKTSNLKYKTDLKAKAEKISIDDVCSFQIKKEGKELTYKTILLEETGTFGGLSLSKKKRWCQLMHDGLFKIYSVRAEANNGGSGSVIFYALYLQEPDKQHANYFDYQSSGGLHFKVNAGKITRIGLRNIFKRNCPSLGEALIQDEFVAEMEEKGIQVVEHFYSENCRKN